MKNPRIIRKTHRQIWECMNKDQFIFWLKGFTKAVDKEQPTPKQWETIVSELDKVKGLISFHIDESKLDIPDTASVGQRSYYIDPYRTITNASSGTAPVADNKVNGRTISTATSYPKGISRSYTDDLL